MKVSPEHLKTAGAAAVILAAAVIMAPGLFNLAAGITRMLIIIGIGFGVSLAVALIWYNLKKRTQAASPANTPVSPGTDGNPS